MVCGVVVIILILFDLFIIMFLVLLGRSSFFLNINGWVIIFNYNI